MKKGAWAWGHRWEACGTGDILEGGMAGCSTFVAGGWQWGAGIGLWPEMGPSEEGVFMSSPRCEGPGREGLGAGRQGGPG